MNRSILRAAACAALVSATLLAVPEVRAEDAATTAVKTAQSTLRDLRVAEVIQMDLSVDEGGTFTYRTKLQLSFKYEHST